MLLPGTDIRSVWIILIKEVAALRDPSVKLLLCGHPEAETNALKLLAAKELGTNVRWFTLVPEDVHRALYISDVFVLPSSQRGCRMH